jgi:hypothetical protein
VKQGVKVRQKTIVNGSLTAVGEYGEDYDEAEKEKDGEGTTGALVIHTYHSLLKIVVHLHLLLLQLHLLLGKIQISI